MAVLQVMTVIFGDRIFLFLGFTVSAGWLILMPIIFYLFQIVSECYGWQYARQIIWLNFIVNLSTTIIMLSFKLLPFNWNNHSDIDNAYVTLLKYQTMPAITMLIGMFLSDYVTSALMCWSRFHWNGRFLMLRIAILHCIGELIINSGGMIVQPLNGYSLQESWMMCCNSFYARSLVMLALLPIARVVIWGIQNYLEKVIVFEYNNQYKFFKFVIDPSKMIFFDAKQWKICPNKKELNIEKTAAQYNSSFADINIRIH